MRSVKWLGLLAVVAGSFLPLVHLPFAGNWNYWHLDHRLAIACWFLAAVALAGMVFGSTKILRVASLALIVLFAFTIVAVKIKALDSFSFVFVKSLQKSLARVVKLSWGWFVEFVGAALMLAFSKK